VTTPAGDEPADQKNQLLFELLGQDRPGIIREVTSLLAQLGANIESLSSGEETGAWGGERLFRAHIAVTLPDGLAAATVQEKLEAISQELMVDFSFGSARDT